MTAFAIELEALGDTWPLWKAWLEDAARVLGVDAATLPSDRAAAAATLDASGAGNWRTLLERFAEDHAPVYLRPSAEVSAALRRLAGTGASIGIFTDAPTELATVALAHLGAARRAEVLESGASAKDRLLARLGVEAMVVESRDALVAAG